MLWILYTVIREQIWFRVILVHECR